MPAWLWFALVVLAWVFVVPPGAGPDEQAHFARAGAATSVDYLEATLRGGTGGVFSLDERFALPPTCYAFQPEVPVSCADSFVAANVVDLPAAANDYQVWAHVLAGAVSRLPLGDPLLLARLSFAIVNSFLIALAFSAFKDVGRLGVLVAMTPAVWVLNGSLNPSSLTISGGIALWTALSVGRTGPIPSWLFSLGWCAMTLTRGDGALLAVCVVVFAALLDSRCLDNLLSMSRRSIVVCGSASLLVSIWAVTRTSIEDQIVVAAPLIGVAGIYLAKRAPTSIASSDTVRLCGLVALCSGVLAAAFAAYGAGSVFDVVSRTGYWLDGYVTLGGWNDVQAAQGVTLLLLFLLGVVVMYALRQDAYRDIAYLAALVGAAFVAAVAAELVVTEGSGQYFQGRYLGPLFVGIPILLAGRVDGLPTINVARLWRYALPVWLVMVNCHLLFAARRWGAGVSGSWYPGDWGHRFATVPVSAAILLHLLATVALGISMFSKSPDRFGLSAAKPYETLASSERSLGI